jgi:hypothetical protein
MQQLFVGNIGELTDTIVGQIQFGDTPQVE